MTVWTANWSDRMPQPFLDCIGMQQARRKSRQPFDALQRVMYNPLFPGLRTVQRLDAGGNLLNI
jgi:hypothetical protein